MTCKYGAPRYVGGIWAHIWTYYTDINWNFMFFEFSATVIPIVKGKIAWPLKLGPKKNYNMTGILVLHNINSWDRKLALGVVVMCPSQWGSLLRNMNHRL